MMTREDFYLEQLLPLFKEMDKLNDERNRRYNRLEADHEQKLAQLIDQRRELRESCAKENMMLDKAICELRGDISPEGDARRTELMHKQQKNKLEMQDAIDLVDASIRKVNARYRTDKVHLCNEMHDKKARLQLLISARNKDYKRMRYEEIMKRRHQWNPLKRWIFRRFFWVSEEKKGGEV